MKIKLSSSPAPERLGNKDRSITHNQEGTSDMISKIRRGVHTVWGGIGANEERKLRDVLRQLVDDVDGLEKMLSSTTKRGREDDESVSDTKRHKTDSSVDESPHHNKDSVSPSHIAADALRKIEKIEGDADLLNTMSFASVVDLTSASEDESRMDSTAHKLDAPSAPKATINEKCGHQTNTHDIFMCDAKYDYGWVNDSDSSDEETQGGTVQPQKAHQHHSLNAIEMWFRHKVHHGDELLGLLALIDFHESDPKNCKAGSESCWNLRQKVEDAEKSMGCDWDKSVGPLAFDVSTHLKDAGENLEDVLERFQDHAKAIEPQPDFDDLLLDNAEYIDRIRPSEKHQVYSTGVGRLPPPTFLQSHRQTLPRSSCRPHLLSQIVASAPTQTNKSQHVAYLSNVSTVSRGLSTSHGPANRSQPETTKPSGILSEPKKVHWPTEKETIADTGKDLSEDRCEAIDEDDSDLWSESDEEPESDGDEYSDEDDGEDDAEDDHGCNNVRVNRAQIQMLNTMLEEHDRQTDPGSYCSGEHEDVEHGLDMCGVFADEETGEAMIDGVAYEIAKHFYEFGLSPRKTLKRYITSGKKCEWSWGKEESVAARRLRPWFRERAWYSIKH